MSAAQSQGALVEYCVSGIRVFQEIDDVVKKAEKGSHEKGSSNLYSESEFSWFAIESHNLGTQLSMIGDDDKAKVRLSLLDPILSSNSPFRNNISLSLSTFSPYNRLFSRLHSTWSKMQIKRLAAMSNRCSARTQIQ